MSTRSELQNVEAADVDAVDAGNVLESANNDIIFVVDHERTTSLGVAAVAGLARACAELARVDDLVDIGVGSRRFEESHSLFRLGDALDGVSDDERHFLELLDAVTTGEDERREGRSGNGRHNGVAALVLVGLDVPLAPDLGRRKHASTSAHVTEGSLQATSLYRFDLDGAALAHLSRAVGTTTADTRNTCNGTTSTP